ncbi:MAG: ribonuclease H-like domain-containing protein [Bryobacteraceae bacterium]
MQDIQEQLAALRQRIARIDRRYGSPPVPRPNAFPPTAYEGDLPVIETVPGVEVETEFGRHFEMERSWEAHKAHGSADIGALCELPHDLLHAISNGLIPSAPPETWAFLDTETTGLAGGSGTYAFLVGVGRITREGFHVRQFFMRDYGEEASMLTALTKYLEQFQVLITYNGRTYDQPLLETRYRMSRQRPPFARLEHLDLLFGARRLWKLRFESCRLVELENQILGVERYGDIPGAMIPYVYFEYLRRKEAARLQPVFYHNAMDILTLGCLTGIVPWAFHEPERVNLRHGAEMVGLGRWLRQAEQYDAALTLFRKGIDAGLHDELLFRTMWDVAALEKKLERMNGAIAAFTDLVASPNPYRVRAYEELAKHYEHGEKSYAMALEMTRCALAIEDTADLRKRELRLLKRSTVRRTARLV